MNEYNLKIINQIFCNNIKFLKILNRESNKFYDYGEKEYSDYKNNDKNETYSVSIFN